MCHNLTRPRSGDELDSKIRKAEREIRALENTLAHLLTRNQKYKENFKKVDKRAEQQVLEKQQLDEQSRAANETLFKKKQHLAQVDKEFEEDSKRMEELQRQQNALLEAPAACLSTNSKFETRFCFSQKSILQQLYQSIIQFFEAYLQNSCHN